MNILALDTSSKACSIAVAFEDKIYSRHILAPMQQAQTILPLLDELLKSAELTLKDINGIAFGRGPGSFTGLRIAVSVAQGLGYALNIPLISISSLATIAQSAFLEKKWKNMLVATDARLNEVYAGAYQINSKGLAELIETEKVISPKQLKVPDENSSKWFGVGDGWVTYSSQICCQVIEIHGNCDPDARAMLMLAREKWQSGDVISAEKALPVYLRDEVAVKSNKR